MPAEPETPEGPARHDDLGDDRIARAAARAGISRDELLDRAAAHAGISREEFDQGRERLARTLVRSWLRRLREQDEAAPPPPPPTEEDIRRLPRYNPRRRRPRGY